MLRAKRILAIAASVALITLPAWAASFTDLPTNSPRGVLALMLAERGILPGVSDTQYGGATSLSRYELATVLNALLDPKDVASNIVAWSDIPPGHPSMPSVNNVTSKDLMEGVNGRFMGLRRVSRLEFVMALVHLLNYRLVSAPPRRAGAPLTFSDVSGGSEAGITLDRAANFWQIVDAPRRSRFRPNDYVTRFEAVDFLARALLLTDPTMEAPIRAAMAMSQPIATPTPEPVETPEPTRPPTPVPTDAPVETPRPVRTPGVRPTARPTPQESDRSTWLPSATPAPVASPTPKPAPTPHRPFWDTGASPAPSAAPQVQPTPTPAPTKASPVYRAPQGADLLVNRGRIGLEAVLAYMGGGLQANVPGMVNLDASGQYWMGGLGGSAQLSTIYPIAVSGGGSQYFDLSLHGEGLYKLPFRGPDWQLAGGASALLHALSGSGNASETAFGLGPAGQLAYHMTPALTMSGALQLYPVYIQAVGASMGAGVGSGWQFGGDYEVHHMGSSVITVGLYYNGTLGLSFDGSSVSTAQSVTVGAGGTF